MTTRERLDHVAVATDGKSTSELMSDLSTHLGRLIQAELRLAQLELRRKTKRAGLGAGLLSVGAVGAVLGGATLIACAVIALALVWPWWLAALAVGGVVLLGSGLAAGIGALALRRAVPPVPKWAADSVREDVRTIAKGVRR